MTISENYKNRINAFKNRLRDRAKQIKSLKKRIKEIICSRDKWKQKFQIAQTRIKELEKINKQLEKEKQQLKKKP